MKSVGFPISHKENENRRALIPSDIRKISSPEKLFFESGYGNVLGLNDDDYRASGANVVSRGVVLKQDIICDPKVGDAEYLSQLSNQTIFGWIHAVRNKDIADAIIQGGLTAYAWEDMFEEGRHVFYRNNELAGEAAIMHAFQCFGQMPYETKVALIGKGNTARGAMKVLNMLGADVMQYDRKSEQLLRDELSNYDVVVNCVLWDLTREDHIIGKEDLKRMKKGSMIIDVSCDKNGAIETSVPTTFDNPTYKVDGITHYVVDHTPSLFYKTFTKNNSEIIAPFIEDLMTNKPGKILKDALIIEGGKIIDARIEAFQQRSNK